MEQLTSSNFPIAIDINPTARCNLDCSFCWGPDHSIPDGLTLMQWQRTLEFFKSHGTESVVVTGGEPLIREDLPEILSFAKRLDLRVTLSTNALLLRKKHEAVLPFVDEIGLPLDGGTPEDNQEMRKGTRRSFNAVIDAMSLVRTQYPTIEITIRTVISRVNSFKIESLARLLEMRTEFFDRWKIYQFTPFSIGAANRREHEIGDEDFRMVMSRIEASCGFCGRVVFQTASEAKGRYIFVGPLGDVYGVNNVGEYCVAGSVLSDDLEQLSKDISRRVDEKRNISHAIARTRLRVVAQAS